MRLIEEQIFSIYRTDVHLIQEKEILLNTLKVHQRQCDKWQTDLDELTSSDFISIFIT